MKAEIRPKNADWETYSLVGQCFFFFCLTRSVERQVSAETSQVASWRKTTLLKSEKACQRSSKCVTKTNCPLLTWLVSYKPLRPTFKLTNTCFPLNKGFTFILTTVSVCFWSHFIWNFNIHRDYALFNWTVKQSESETRSLFSVHI